MWPTGGIERGLTYVNPSPKLRLLRMGYQEQGLTNMRGMKLGLARGAVFIGALLGASSGAWAAAGITSATVEALAPVVTYSRLANPPRIPALTTYLAYRVTVNNTSGNTINNVFFDGNLVILDQQEQAEFAPTLTDGATCAVVFPPDPSLYGNSVKVRCDIGQLKALGQPTSSRTFTLFFKAPVQDTASPIPAGDYAGFSGQIVTAEGANAGNSPNDSVDPWPLGTTDSCLVDPDPLTTSTATYPCVKISLGTPNARLVKSAVPKAGGSFFTGDGGVTGLLGGDPFTTSVSVPTSAVIAKAIIEETPGAATANFLASYATDLAIVDATSNATANYAPALLSIVLRMDVANNVRGTKINNVKITYGDVPVVACTVKGVLNTAGVPCINESKYYRNKGVAGWTPDLDGDFEWTIINTTNGRFGIE
jgi:hypothetical protein